MSTTGGPENGATREFWDQWWGERQRVNTRALRENHHFYGTRGLLVRAVAPLIGGTTIGSICEFGGGGGGYWLFALSRWLGARPVCIDRSEVGLELTRRVFETAGVEVETIWDDVLTHDFAGHKYDLVVHWGLLEHFADPTAVLAKTVEVLPIDGLTVFSMPNLLAYGARWWRDWAPESWAQHVLHTEASLAASARASGLELRGAKCFGGPLFRMARWEKPGWSAPLVTLGHRMTKLAERLVPGWWADSPCRYAKHRLFSAVIRPADPQAGPAVPT